VAKIGCLRSRPQAVFIFVRGPPRPGSSTKCQVSYDWSWPQEAPGAKTSLVQKRVEIGLSVDRTALGLQ